MSEKALGRELRVQFTPTLLFLDEKGTVALRLNGYLPPHRLDAALDYAAGLAGRGMRYDEYVKSAIKEAASATLHDLRNTQTTWARELQVVYTPTIVVFERGEKVDLWN